MRPGFSQRTVYAHNPLPPVDAEEVLERGGVPDTNQRKGVDFGLTWVYSGGEDRESIAMKPGDFYPLRESEAREFLRDMSEQGGVIVDLPNGEIPTATHPEVKRQARIGLERARSFYTYRGKSKITEFRRIKKLTADEIELSRYVECFWWHVNQAKADLISELLRGAREQAAA